MANQSCFTDTCQQVCYPLFMKTIPVKQVAQTLKVSPDTIYKHISRGLLKKDDKTATVTADSLERYLKRRGAYHQEQLAKYRSAYKFLERSKTK